MSALDQTPLNTNYLNPLNFQFSIKRAPHVNFFIQRVNIPSLTLPFIMTPTIFQPIPHSGARIEYGDFKVSFKVDEDLLNYMEIFNWIEKLGYPENFQQYQSIANNSLESGNGITSDITLLILNGINRPNFEITMRDAFPISLTTDEFTTTDDSVNYVTATASFKYLQFKPIDYAAE
jgi:hypothetical protein